MLRIAGAERRQIDVVVCTPSLFQRHYFTHHPPHERVREELRRLTGRAKTHEVAVVVGKKAGRSAYDVFNSAALYWPISAFAPMHACFFRTTI